MNEKLHAAIREGNLDEVKAFFLNENKDEKDSIYLSSKGNSALWTAIKAGKFEIYAFLKSKGLNFKDEMEQQCIVYLNDPQKNSLSKALVQYFTAVDNAHILYLVSKTKSFQEQVKQTNFQEQIKKLYEELDKIPEISIILKVMQYCDYLDIIVDFKKSSVIDINPRHTEVVKGLCDHENRQLYIGLKLDKKNNEHDRLGTLAHEFTHSVMQTIYKNKGNPYCQSDVQQKSKFETIVEKIQKKTVDNKGNITVDDIITRVFTLYKENVWPAELIVRVPHMFAKYGTVKGREKLEAQALELLEYYEENVKPSCERFIENSYLIKPRNDILLLNQYSGIVDRITELKIQFKEPVDFKDFFENNNKQVLVLNVTNNTWLCSINIYQSVQKIPPYSLMYLFLKFDHYVKQREKINNTFYYSETSNLLIIQSPDNSDEEKLKALLVSSLYILNKKPHKKIIFIINESELNGFIATLNSIANSDPAAFLQNEHYEIKKLKKDFILNDLTDESQKKLLEKKVTFQAQVNSLENLIHDVKNLKEIVHDANTLENLINEVTIDSKLPVSSWYDASYYIERTLIYQPTIKMEVFKAKTSLGKEITDVFAVSNIKQENLKKLLPQGNDVQLFEGGTNDKITRFYVLNTEQAPRLFRELCQKNPEFNVHWLKHESESNSFIWQQSQGSLSILRQHIDSDYTESYLETEYKQQTDYYKKIIIISDKAGMGKSTILTSFSQLIKKKNPDVWLTRIDLNDHTDKLKEQKEKASFKSQEIDIAIAFLADNLLHLKTPFEQALFKHYCHNSKLIVMFDGFDEISPDYKETVIDLILTLRKSQIEQIWITTRPNMRADLEDALQQFAHVLKPFSGHDQKMFLTKYWAHKLNLSKDNNKLEVFTEGLIELLAKSISDEEKEFTGIPLQTRMLAEIFQDKCQEFCNSEQLIPISYHKLDLIDLYERFFKKKSDIYQVEKNKLDISKPGVESSELYSKFIKEHQSLALYTLFGEEERKVLLNEKFCQELSAEYPQLAQAMSQQENLTALLMKDKQNTIHALMENIKEGKEKIGIIDQIKEDKPHFIHRTFAEYLAANFLVNSLQQQIMINSTEIQEFIIKGVLIESDYQVIRAFVNGFLKEKVSLPESTLKLYGKKITDLWKLDMRQLENKKLCNKNDDTILHIAAMENNVNIVSFLLDSVIKHEEVLKSLNEPTNKGNIDTIIHLTVERDKDIEAFIDAKNKDNTDNKTALHISAERGYLDVLICLIKKGADVNAKTARNGWTPLHLAAIYCNSEIVKYLVANGANVNEKTCNGETPLYYAARKCKLDIVEYLVENKARVNILTNDGETPLHSAVAEGNLEVVKYLVEKGADINILTKDGRRAFTSAVRQGNLEVFKYLVEKGADINMKAGSGWTLLHSAVAGGNLELVQYLVKKGANVNAKTCYGMTPLHYAARECNLDIVKYLVESKAHVNLLTKYGRTSLNLAIVGGSLEVVKYLVEQGADVNVTNKYGKTTLYLAVMRDNVEVIKYLVGKGADVNEANEDGETPLHSVASKGNLEVVKYLVENRADVNISAKDGRTPLFMAARGGNLEVVKYLVEKGAKVNVTDNNGSTLLCS